MLNGLQIQGREPLLQTNEDTSRTYPVWRQSRWCESNDFKSQTGGGAGTHSSV